MVDVFEEVDEQLRSARLKQLGLKAAPWAIAVLAAALVVVLAIWGLQTYRAQNSQKASLAYSQGLEALGRGDTVAAFAQFDAVAATSAKAYRALALMQEAGIRLEQHRTSEAVGLFDQAAAAAPDNIIGDAARLKSAFALLDTAPYGDVEARLKPLLDSQRPYKAEAREALAMAKLNAGRMADARSDFVVVSLLSDSTDAMRERAHAAISLIDSGSASTTPSLVKAALAAPPPAAPPQGAPADGSSPDGSPPSDQTSQGGTAQ